MNTFAFCVFLTLAVSAFAAPSSTTNQLPDNLYYLTNLTFSENESKIAFYQVQVNLTDNRFTSFAESLRHKNKLASRTLFNGERNLTAIGFLNITNQECVVHYGKLPELVDVQKTINDCVDEALFEGKTLFKKVTFQLDQARVENSYVRPAVENCNANSTGYKLVECVSNVITPKNLRIRDFLATADRELQLAFANYDDLARQAMECTYNVVEGLGKNVENVLRTINECQTNTLA